MFLTVPREILNFGKIAQCMFSIIKSKYIVSYKGL